MRTLWNQCNGQGERSQSLWKPSIFRQKMGFSGKRWDSQAKDGLWNSELRCKARVEDAVRLQKEKQPITGNFGGYVARWRRMRCSIRSMLQ